MRTSLVCFLRRLAARLLRPAAPSPRPARKRSVVRSWEFDEADPSVLAVTLCPAEGSWAITFSPAVIDRVGTRLFLLADGRPS